ncbi:hypothetical protein J1605_012790 [Eschrichtius robustus]|uniref:Uncharacterized protein n=1 Tax=Eschrichtius robustus TaxID=9764 RepID=A0AB34GH74_ESCRO|nr:hypothetical protein J1605_012790 [Eschrichtius robustus]
MSRRMRCMHVPNYHTTRRQALLSTLPFPLAPLLSSMRTLMLPCTLILHILSLQLLPLDSSKANMVEAILHPVLFSTISTRPPRLSIWPVRSSTGLYQSTPHGPCTSGSCTVRNGSFSSNCPCANDANDDTATRRSPGRPRSKCTTAHSSLDNSAFPLYDAPFR